MKLTPCIKVLKNVIKRHQSLTDSFVEFDVNAEQKAVCYGVIRWYFELQYLLNMLLNEPLKEKNLPVALYIYCGLFQLLHGNMPDYAVVKEIVANIKQSKFRWAAGLANKILRQCVDQKENLLQALKNHPVAHFAHPQWMIDRLSPEVLHANNHQAPMTLRVNLTKLPRSKYLKMLMENDIAAKPLDSSNAAIQLKEPVLVSRLPGFEAGLVSVQDEAGQLVNDALVLEPNLRVLDACCAPGSKTGHILEAQPQLDALVAIDSDPQRLQKVAETIERLDLNQSMVTLIAADAGDTQDWWDGKLFDRILLDVPCSASGVIRRHPDIKILRRESDIAALQQRQLTLLEKLAPLLAPGGLLIYSTCSVFAAENTDVVTLFCKQHNLTLTGERQLYPEVGGHDGFYIAVLQAP